VSLTLSHISIEKFRGGKSYKSPVLLGDKREDLPAEPNLTPDVRSAAQSAVLRRHLLCRRPTSCRDTPRAGRLYATTLSEEGAQAIVLASANLVEQRSSADLLPPSLAPSCPCLLFLVSYSFPLLSLLRQVLSSSPSPVLPSSGLLTLDGSVPAHRRSQTTPPVLVSSLSAPFLTIIGRISPSAMIYTRPGSSDPGLPCPPFPPLPYIM
jgi:hypothetical protein